MKHGKTEYNGRPYRTVELSYHEVHHIIKRDLGCMTATDTLTVVYNDIEMGWSTGVGSFSNLAIATAAIHDWDVYFNLADSWDLVAWHLYNMLVTKRQI